MKKHVSLRGEDSDRLCSSAHTVDPLPEASAKNALVSTVGLGEVPVFGNHQREAAS